MESPREYIVVQGKRCFNFSELKQLLTQENAADIADIAHKFLQGTVYVNYLDKVDAHRTV